PHSAARIFRLTDVISLCILLCAEAVCVLCIRSSLSAEVSLCSLSSTVELRQAIVAMMNRKDELEEQNTSLRSLLDGEMEHSAGLRQETDLLKKRLTELEERHSAKVQALARENEVLKVQLKKYVGAVQMLKREGSQEQAPLPQNKFMGDIEELAASYERKLIEVAEMHGELIEFNERLYRSLMAKDHLIVQMRQELIDLRGPVPGDLSQTSDDPSLSDFETAHRALINVWIPSVFLQGRAANAYHVYQVYIRILDNEWNVYRRYTEFRELHNHLRTQFPQVDTFNFPPKKAIGNKVRLLFHLMDKHGQGNIWSCLVCPSMFKGLGTDGPIWTSIYTLHENMQNKSITKFYLIFKKCDENISSRKVNMN
uniref:Sorting nexin-29-like n=1 Tax=Acanthochromis polyacanthus TaxID=80966 RepID=A0A3Q1EU11_9TELE